MTRTHYERGSLPACCGQTKPAGCQGRTKVRPRWRRKIRPPGPVDGVPESGCAAGLERRLGAPVGAARQMLLRAGADELDADQQVRLFKSSPFEKVTERYGADGIRSRRR